MIVSLVFSFAFLLSNSKEHPPNYVIHALIFRLYFSLILLVVPFLVVCFGFCFRNSLFRCCCCCCYFSHVGYVCLFDPFFQHFAMLTISPFVHCVSTFDAANCKYVTIVVHGSGFLSVRLWECHHVCIQLFIRLRIFCDSMLCSLSHQIEINVQSFL